MLQKLSANRWFLGSPHPVAQFGVQQQQVHLNLQVEDPYIAHQELVALGATVLEPEKTFEAPEGFRVYADPAGHPFCIAWGQPSAEDIQAFLSKRAKQSSFLDGAQWNKRAQN